MIRIPALLALIVMFATPPAVAGKFDCPPAGTWIDTNGAQLDRERLLDGLAHPHIVLLGEHHAEATHQRWQLDTVRALHQRHADIVIALEMFPRRVQPALDAWVAGELDEAEFLDRSDWEHVWGFPPESYLGLFRYARQHALPMRALNVERSLVRQVSRNGLASVPPGAREGVSQPAAASERYADWLGTIHAQHHGAGQATDDDATQNFIEAQLVWDRAFADGLHAARNAHPQAIVVGVIGRGHLRHGLGVAHQLDDLDAGPHTTLLPWDRDGDGCTAPEPGLADALHITAVENATR